MVQPIERAGRPRQNTKKTKQNKTTACAYIYMGKTNTNKRKRSVEESIDLEPFKVGKLALR